MTASVWAVTLAGGGDFLEGLGVERPVVQAGMAGGVAGGELAGAVSAAGGLGTVGMMGVKAFASALSTAHARAQGRPLAANLLVPFIREGHARACGEAGVALVVLHGGRSERWVQRLRRRGLRVLVTVGDAREAQLALGDGASGLVVQGSEAGGRSLRPVCRGERAAHARPVACRRGGGAADAVTVAGGMIATQPGRLQL
jgi:nitronate monooxygenase